MYGEDIYKSFVALRDQFYRCKTFRRFCNDCEEYFSRRYRNEVTDETIQEVFDNCLERSNKKCLKRTLIGY